MKSESLSTVMGLVDKSCEKRKTFFSLMDNFTLDIGRPYKC